MKWYAILNTATGQFYQFLPTSEISTDLEQTKSVARQLNEAMVPEFQNFSVVTVILNPEV